ncbi:MAG: hypothetical protein H8E47_03510 [Anaerolineales bacterium]|nr:hypothetical protein [Anaerolineales bacterium]
MILDGSFVIDDHAKATELMRKMETQLPIPARPTSAFVRAMREQGVKIPRDQELQIKRVFYAGDEGGIMCDVTLSEEAKEAIIVSITHLRVPPRHPLAKEIREYQQERTRRLAQSRGSGKPSQVTARPRNGIR